jgi:hypothetical protein
MIRVNETALKGYLVKNSMVPLSKDYYSLVQKIDATQSKLTSETSEAIKKILAKEGNALEKKRKVAFTNALNSKVLSIITEFSVNYAGPLAGYQTGFLEMENNRILVTESPRLIVPVQCDFTIIRIILSNQFGICDDRDDWIYFDAWLKTSVELLYKGTIRPGLILMLCGPKSSGKNLIQDTIITPLLGGRMADPTQYALGCTFNDAAIGACHLRIADSRAVDRKSKDRLGAFIKSIAGNKEQELHPKNKPAFTAMPFWRLSMSFNEEKEDLEIVPDLDDEAVAAKMLILHSQKKPIPMGNQYEARAEAIAQALPGYLYHLMHWEIPERLLDPDTRFE